ncbi:MAG: alpha/beta fold hydrolase [Acidimicrobiia bacterium]|nr:alpha/beta fold hydrolase [Acidimicrobiia bacterium]
MNFTGEPSTSHGVVERRFDVDGERETVPGIVWTPEASTGPRPLVLVGHGGGGNKRMPYVLSLARRLVRHAGYAVVAIDGVGHGDRASATRTADRGSGEGISRTFVADVAAAADAMTADWTVVLRELRELDDVGDGPLGYWGVSMGTMFGAPFVAATPEVRCAVLGLMGTLDDTNPWSTAAPAISCPVLFLVQLDDELVPTESALALFRSIGSQDKRLHAHPGAHAAVPAEEMEASEAFFATHLT